MATMCDFALLWVIVPRRRRSLFILSPTGGTESNILMAVDYNSIHRDFVIGIILVKSRTITLG